jgi:hypothetical protein
MKEGVKSYSYSLHELCITKSTTVGTHFGSKSKKQKAAYIHKSFKNLPLSDMLMLFLMIT